LSALPGSERARGPAMQRAPTLAFKALMRGDAAPALIAIFSAAVVKFVVVPLYEASLRARAPVLASLLPAHVLPYYDPSRDHAFNMMLLAALAGYFIMSFCICSVLDLSPRLTARFKVQGEKNYFTVAEWLYTVSVCAANVFVFSWVATVPCWHVQRSGLLRHGSAVTALSEPFEFGSAVIDFMWHILIIEVWFYTTHRALHHPALYKHVHKLHHMWKAPTAVACMFAHPIEFLVGNTLGVVLGPALTNAHPYSSMFWMAFALASTSGAHSGYFVFGAESHDRHHEFFDYNFGVSVFMDKLLGTEFDGSGPAKRLKGKRAEPWHEKLM